MLAAMQTIATGIKRRMPPAKIRHRTKTGSARTIRIPAHSFAMPQLNRNARPMLLIKIQMKKRTIISSNMHSSFLAGRRMVMCLLLNAIAASAHFSCEDHLLLCGRKVALNKSLYKMER